MQTDSGEFAFRFCSPQGRHQESYLPVSRLYKERRQKLEYKYLIYYYVNFDHMWVEHYPVTLIVLGSMIRI